LLLTGWKAASTSSPTPAPALQVRQSGDAMFSGGMELYTRYIFSRCSAAVPTGRGCLLVFKDDQSLIPGDRRIHHCTDGERNCS
jgi:hypothetical protein